MLVLTRKVGERLFIELAPGVDPATPVGEFFRRGPVEIVVTRITSANVRLGIQAHSGLLILRGELA